MCKCPVCKSCMVHRLYKNSIYYYCDLCDTFYRIKPGRILELVDEGTKKLLQVGEEYKPIKQSQN